MSSGLKPALFRFPDLPEREEGALLIWPPRLVYTPTGSTVTMVLRVMGAMLMAVTMVVILKAVILMTMTMVVTVKTVMVMARQ